MKGNASIHTANDKYREGWDRVFGDDVISLKHVQKIAKEAKSRQIPLIEINDEYIDCVIKPNGGCGRFVLPDNDEVKKLSMKMKDFCNQRIDMINGLK